MAEWTPIHANIECSYEETRHLPADTKNKMILFRGLLFPGSSFWQVDQSVSCFSLVPRAVDRPLLLVAGMLETAGLEIFARVEKKVHEALIKAEFCPYLQVRRRRDPVMDMECWTSVFCLLWIG